MKQIGNFGGNVDTSSLVPKTTTLTINGTTQDLSTNRSFTVLGGSTYVTKTTDESISSNTTLQDDDQLLFAMDADGIYEIDISLRLVSTVNNNLKLAFIVPSYPSGISTQYTLTSTQKGSSTSGPYVATSAPTAMTIATNSGITAYETVLIKGVVANGTSAGNFVMQWAQVTSNATAITILKGSTLAYKKLN